MSSLASRLTYYLATIWTSTDGGLSIPENARRSITGKATHNREHPVPIWDLAFLILMVALDQVMQHNSQILASSRLARKFWLQQMIDFVSAMPEWSTEFQNTRRSIAHPFAPVRVIKEDIPL